MSRAGLDLIEGRCCCSVMKTQFGCKIEVYLSKRCSRFSEKVANKICVNTKTPLFYSAADGSPGNKGSHQTSLLINCFIPEFMASTLSCKFSSSSIFSNLHLLLCISRSLSFRSVLPLVSLNGSGKTRVSMDTFCLGYSALKSSQGRTKDLDCFLKQAVAV